MTRLFIFFCLLFFSTTTILAQAGHWVGFITQSGKRHPIKIYLQKEGKKTMIGTADIYLDSTLIQLELHGVLHRDQSINLWDISLNDIELGESGPAVFKRRYQLLYRRKWNGESLKGYWQEAYNPNKIMHKQGLIELKKGKTPGKA